MNRVRYGYAAAASIMDYYEYNVPTCLSLLYPPQALIKTRVSDSLKAASQAEAPIGALSAREIILGKAKQALCQERLEELDFLSPPDPM